MVQNQTFLSIYPLPALLNPLPLMPFTTEEIIGCTNEAVKGTNKTPRNPPSCFFISCFTASVTPSINTHEPSNDFTILILSFISSFEINHISPFRALIAPFPLISLPSLFIAFDDKLPINPGTLSLSKEIAIFVSTFFPKLPNQELKDLTD